MVKGRPIIRILLQALVSLAVLSVLVYAARQGNVLASLKGLAAWAVVSAVGLQLVACAINSVRWQVLLDRMNVHERLRPLASLYLIGQFFSLFLPTSAGGDAVRIFQVARRNGRTGHVLLATLQERLFGLGVTMLIGLAATFYFWDLLPSALRVWGVLLQAMGVTAVALLLYPAPLLTFIQWLWTAHRDRPALKHLAGRPVFERLGRALRTLGNLPVLRPRQLLCLLVLAAAAILLSIDTCHILAQALGIDSSFLTYCLVIPLVWLVRMLPISLNGIGVGEGAFVFLMGLFAVPTDKALALALAVLGLQTLVALFGGVLLALSMASGRWRRVPLQQDSTESPAPLPLTAVTAPADNNEVTGHAA
jgi:uncharacterized protein (TIRG00374 family)